MPAAAVDRWLDGRRLMRIDRTCSVHILCTTSRVYRVTCVGRAEWDGECQA
jgi:hypothetical protein